MNQYKISCTVVFDYTSFVQLGGVDLDLPSGTLWASINVWTFIETDFGKYYLYGACSNVYDSTDTK